MVIGYIFLLIVSFYQVYTVDLKAKKEVINKAFEHTYENFVYFINVIIDDSEVEVCTSRIECNIV